MSRSMIHLRYWQDYCISTSQKMSVDIGATPDLLLLILLIQQKLRIVQYWYWYGIVFPRYLQVTFATNCNQCASWQSSDCKLETTHWTFLVLSLNASVLSAKVSQTLVYFFCDVSSEISAHSVSSCSCSQDRSEFTTNRTQTWIKSNSTFNDNVIKLSMLTCKQNDIQHSYLRTT